jgi:hypothetical protein
LTASYLSYLHSGKGLADSPDRLANQGVRMVSSYHSHDAMRRLLKAAVGVPKVPKEKTVQAETVASQRFATHRQDSAGLKANPDSHPSRRIGS